MVSLTTEKDQSELDEQWISNNSNKGLKLQQMITASGISVRLWRLYAYFWFICLLFPILTLIQIRPSGLYLLITASGLIIFVAAYFWIMWPHPISDQTRTKLGLWTSLVLIVALTVLVLFLSIINGTSFLWLFIGVSAIAGMTLSFRNAFITVIGLTLLTIVANVGMDGGIKTANWFQIIPLALLVRGLGLDMIGFVRLSDALRELQRAREELAHQAVTEERLRMARDLHDLLGHTLSLITMKSELAWRLLKKDPLTATEQVHDVERVARQALRDVREAVAGYRQRTLRGELDGARQILEAAGVECTIEYESQSLPSGIDMVLAWVVREGVTNVIRHTRAQRCLIRITSSYMYVRAEISNDGYPRKEGSTIEWGSGLSGLSERVSNAGGKLEVRRQPTSNSPGFQLSVEIPIEATQ
jgi:two-component system, NarL family, sensor histidine kinase DesK